MRLERLHEYLTVATAIIVGTALALWLGLLVGSGSTGLTSAVLGGLCFTGLLLKLREHAWVLLVVLWTFSGGLPQVPAHPALRDLVAVAVFCWIFTLTAVKLIRFQPSVDAADWWLRAMLLYTFLTWARHPTGGLVLQSDRIGGRVYFNVAVAVAAYYVLNRAFMPRTWKPQVLLFWYLGLATLQGLIEMAIAQSPLVNRAFGSYYGGFTPTEDAPLDPASPLPEPGQERLNFMSSLVSPWIQFLVVLYRPLTLVSPLFPFRTTFFLLLMVGNLLAGFRSTLLAVAGYFLVSSFLRRGFFEAFRVLAIGFVVAIFITFLSHFLHLPFPVQRALAILPGQWDRMAIQSGQHSSEWRFQMWREVMTNPRYLQNKLIGDGFGYSMEQYAQSVRAIREGNTPEHFMLTGQVHSGPISSIRYVGYCGLLIYLGLSFSCAREGLRLCRTTMKEDLGPLVWLLCLPIIWQPVNFIVIYGALDTDLPAQIYALGILKFLKNSYLVRQAQPLKETPRPAAGKLVPVPAAASPRARAVRPVHPTLPIGSHYP